MRKMEKRGDCPVCGYKNAYTETLTRDGKRLGWCASCQDKEAIAAYLRGAYGAVHHAPGLSVSIAQERAERAAKAKERAWVIWAGAENITSGDPAWKYLNSRGIWDTELGMPGFRYRADCPHPDGKRYPALIAMLIDACGKPQGIHRTFLTLDGKKANLDPVKASLGSMWGASIWIRWQVGTPREIVIAEGLESAISAAFLLGLPACSAISAGNLASGLVLSPAIESVIIAADNDKPGLVAAETAAQRWKSEGRAVRILKGPPGHDFNDVLLGQKTI